jgi:hypothetical protein
MKTKLMSKTLQPEHIEDVLLKSRMREIFMSGSVRGLIATLGYYLIKRWAMSSVRQEN